MKTNLIQFDKFVSYTWMKFTGPLFWPVGRCWAGDQLHRRPDGAARRRHQRPRRRHCRRRGRRTEASRLLTETFSITCTFRWTGCCNKWAHTANETSWNHPSPHRVGVAFSFFLKRFYWQVQMFEIFLKKYSKRIGWWPRTKIVGNLWYKFLVNWMDKTVK